MDIYDCCLLLRLHFIYDVIDPLQPNSEHFADQVDQDSIGDVTSYYKWAITKLRWLFLIYLLRSETMKLFLKTGALAV